MGTRSRIALQTGNTIRSIYVQWDGHPGHHGSILCGYYRTEEQANALLDLGDLSSLREEIGEKHGRDNRAHLKWCHAYGRDLGEKDCSAVLHPDTDDLITHANQCSAAYIYLFTDGRWQVCEPGEPWQDLYLTYITEKLTS